MNTSANKDEVMKFPTEFPILAMGLNETDFRELVETIAKKHFPDFDSTKTQTKLSKSDKYISINIVVNATSKEQLDAFYRELTSNKRVKFAL